MRWLILALSAVFLSLGAILSISLFVVPAGALWVRSGGESDANAHYSDEQNAAVAQYSSEDQSPFVEPPQNAIRAPFEAANPETHHPSQPVQEGDAAEHPGAGTSRPVSEGSVSGERAPAQELSIMEPPTPYSQVVDNASAGWFFARGWKEGAGGNARYYGSDFSYVEAPEVGDPALFRVNIPATDYYTVYARWPALKGNNPATLFGVNTTSGIKWNKVDQRRDGGMWVRLGAYKMEAGNRYAVQVSGYRAKGRVVADAVMVVRGTQMAPSATQMAPLQTDTVTATDTGPTGQARGEDVVQEARTHIGTPYVHSPPGSCAAHSSEDCSCFTSLVFARFGVTMPDDPVAQWNYGREVARSQLRPGDLVFFKENGPSNPITHVAIYSGAGNIIHASSYWGSVVERPMKYVSGYYGARRLGQE